ncbi:hypothetical protein ACWCZ5_34565, partial [Streptomyces sp. NPDC001667]
MTTTSEPATSGSGTRSGPGTLGSGRMPGPGVFSEPDNHRTLDAITALDVKLVLPRQLNAATDRDLKFYFNEIPRDPGEDRVFLRKVRIEIPLGPGSPGLTTVSDAKRIRPSVAGGGNGGWAYRGQGTGAPSGKSWFDFGPNNPVEFTGFALALTLPAVRINTVASTAPLQIKITVYTSPAADIPEDQWTASTDTPPGVYKFPTDFEFSGLRVEEVMIPYNTSGTLRWESQAANCTVVYKTMDGEEKRIDVGAEKEWFTPHLTTYTNFRVEARSVEGQNTRVYALNTTALVDTPDLTLNTLNVNGATTTYGKLSVQGETDIFRQQVINFVDLPAGDANRSRSYWLSAPSDGIFCIQFTGGVMDIGLYNPYTEFRLGKRDTPYDDVITCTRAVKRGRFSITVYRTAKGTLHWYSIGSGNL